MDWSRRSLASPVYTGHSSKLYAMVQKRYSYRELRRDALRIASLMAGPPSARTGQPTSRQAAVLLSKSPEEYSFTQLPNTGWSGALSRDPSSWYVHGHGSSAAAASPTLPAEAVASIWFTHA